MAFDLQKVESLLNALGMDLMMVSQDNLVEISGLLGQLGALGEGFAPLESDLPGQVLEALAEGLKAVLRGRVTKVDQVLAQVGSGLSILAELARSLPVQAPFKGNLTAFQADMAKLADAPGFWAAAESPPPPAKVFGAKRPEGGAGIITPKVRETAQAEDFVAERQDLAPPEPSSLSVEKLKTQYTAVLEDLQMHLVSIEQKSDPLSALVSLIRPFRSILGAATLTRFHDAAELAFNAAELIEYVLHDHLPYSTGVTDILLSACDHLLKCFRHLEILPDETRGWDLRPAPEACPPEEISTFSEQLWLARQGVLPVKPASAKPPSSGAAAPPKPKKIGEILVSQGLISQGDLGGVIAAQQSARKATLGDILVAEKLITGEDLNEALAEQEKEPDRKIGDILVRLGKVNFEQIDQAVKRQEEHREAKLGEFLLKSKIGAPDKVAMALREQKQSEGPASAAQTVKVEATKLDDIIDMVGELVIAQSLVIANSTIHHIQEQKLNKDLAQVSRITSELQRSAMTLRMVPIASTFQKMNRLVRDLAHKFDKDVRLETIGSDTEVDRNVVDSIFDPLVHMVRNSLDHGLETQAERKAAGKSHQGTVCLKAYHQSGNVVIEMMDDGRGLDKEKVLKKAEEKGLITPGKTLSDAAIHALVFLPGFSTSDNVSEISGRGVGMDVVKQSIEKLRGKVEFTSVWGRGSTTTIRLPLTLAIIDGMIVRVGEHRYILPTVSILESFQPPRSNYFTVKNQGEMIKVRDQLVPLIRLDRLLGVEGGVTRPEEGLVVVVETGGETRCLLVDQVLGKQEVVIKSLGETLKGVRTLAGGTILGDGRVGLILDVAGLCGTAAEVANGHSALSGGLEADDWAMGGG